MYVEKRDSIIRETLKNLCRSYGWCYGIFWGFHQRNSLLLTLKDAYYDEQMGALIDKMLMQVHVLGEGVIGQTAITKTHRWMCSNDAEFYSQFSMGIKTIAVISVEPWGVVQLGSSQKIHEIKEFIDYVKELFRGIDKDRKLELSNEPSSSDDLFRDSDMQFCPILMLSLTENQLLTGCEMTTRLEPGSFIDCAATQTLSDNTDCSVLTSSWPSFPSGLRANVSFSTPVSDDFPQLISPLPLSNLSSQNSQNVPTNLTQSSVTDAFRCEREDWDMFGVDMRLNKPNSWIELVEGMTSRSISRFEDQTSSTAKRRKIDVCSWSNNEVKFQSESNFDGTKKLQNAIKLNREVSTKGPAKTGTKKAKRGNKPRPKDRQMIQDRLAELRELIPNGEKMSIDRLLERTIKHLNFMNRLRKHAESLKQIDNIKSWSVEKGGSSNSGGVTWACQVDDQTMVCPLIVQDLNSPGQMLIEIICNEQGFCLEIADILRGFGLNILKGTMEVCETKIWAHFMVEAKNEQTTRHQIFSLLMQLLQANSRHLANMNNHFGNVISSDEYIFDNRQSADLFPFDFADGIQLTSL